VSRVAFYEPRHVRSAVTPLAPQDPSAGPVRAGSSWCSSGPGGYPWGRGSALVFPQRRRWRSAGVIALAPVGGLPAPFQLRTGLPIAVVDAGRSPPARALLGASRDDEVSRVEIASSAALDVTAPGDRSQDAGEAQSPGAGSAALAQTNLPRSHSS